MGGLNLDSMMMLLGALLLGNSILHLRSSWRQKDIDPDRCAACYYDLSGLPLDAICPECGGTVRPVPRRVRVIRLDRRGALVSTSLMLLTVVVMNLSRPFIWFAFYRIAGYDRITFSLTHGPCRIGTEGYDLDLVLMELLLFPLIDRFSPRLSTALAMVAIGTVLAIIFGDLYIDWQSGQVRWD